MDTGAGRRRFAASRVARLATAGPSGPHLVPITFVARGDTIDTAVDAKPKRSRRLARLAHIEADPAVCVLVDEYSEDWDELWWVRADGTARILAEGPEFTDAIDALVGKYPQYAADAPAGPVIRIAVHRWRAWSATG